MPVDKGEGFMGIETAKTGKLLYHLTKLSNLESIIQQGMLPRKYILENTCIKSLIDFTGSKVFADATVDSIVLILEKIKDNNNSFEYINEVKDFVLKQFQSKFIFQQQILSNSDLSFSNLGSKVNFDKLNFKTLKVSDIINFKQGIITGNK